MSIGSISGRDTGLFRARRRGHGAPAHRRDKESKKFAEALHRENIDAMLRGDSDTGKTILRDYIKATVGFEKPGEATSTPPKVSFACSARGAIRRLGISSA